MVRLEAMVTVMSLSDTVGLEPFVFAMFTTLLSKSHYQNNGLYRQNLRGNGTATGTDTMLKYRYRSLSHISCNVKVRHNIQ